MRREDEDKNPHLRVGRRARLALRGALLALGIGLGLALVSGSEGDRPAEIDVRATAGKRAAVRGPIGKPGRRGPRGERGRRGRSGPAGEAGPAGTDAPAAIEKQFVSIAWQNGRYEGRDIQAFTAPGIGEGRVRCTPPNPDEPDGVQWIRFLPDDGGSAGEPPERWATTMWTQRVGGNVDDPNRGSTNVIRTARLDRANQTGGFFESLNTASVGHTPESIGSIDGIITTEPFDESTTAPAPTTFRLSWHWNFRDPASARCYVNATFLTEAS